MANPNQAVVEVTILLGQTPNFKFTSNDLTVGPDGKLTFENNGKPGFDIEYRLKSPPSGYLFPDNNIPNHLSQALWSAVGTNDCPKTAGQWDQFKAKKVKPGGLTLEVRNKNECIADFGYVLRVTNDDGENYLELDPGGRNQNGPVAMIAPQVVFVAGAIAATVLVLGAQALFK